MFLLTGNGQGGSKQSNRERIGIFMRRISLLLALVLALSQPACIIAGGYSNDGGFYLWPGSLISIVIVIAVVLWLRRRRR
jgi:hypothetical protein